MSRVVLKTIHYCLNCPNCQEGPHARNGVIYNYRCSIKEKVIVPEEFGQDSFPTWCDLPEEEVMYRSREV